jgi:hypothetical protein
MPSPDSHTHYQYIVPIMSSARIVVRSYRQCYSSLRSLSISATRFNGPRGHDTVESARKAQLDRPLNPHLANTTSTIANDMPSVGKDAPPPDLLSAVDPDFQPSDAVPENTKNLTGGQQKGESDSGANAELGVGEIEGGSFKVEPLRRTGEDVNTTRARLLCPLHLQHHYLL